MTILIITAVVVVGAVWVLRKRTSASPVSSSAPRAPYTTDRDFGDESDKTDDHAHLS